MGRGVDKAVAAAAVPAAADGDAAQFGDDNGDNATSALHAPAEHGPADVASAGAADSSGADDSAAISALWVAMDVDVVLAAGALPQPPPWHGLAESVCWC